MDSETSVLRRRVHDELLGSVAIGQTIDSSAVGRAINQIAPLMERARADLLTKQVLADVHGLGLIEPLFNDPNVTDVMVVGGRGVWIERNGRVEHCDIQVDVDEIRHLIERIVGPLGLRIDRASPMVDARLPDGSRVNAIIPPLAIDGPCLTIRRFGARHIPLESFGSKAQCDYLINAVETKQTILISGGTGAGKTTLLNALGAHIGETERVITIEDTAELRLPLQHVVRLEGRPANAEGAGLVTMRDLVRNALRMRPDRIVLGEVRGGEALDMLQAMNTGHEGSLSTCHANSPADAISRIETMVLMADSGLPLPAVDNQIASAIDIVVQIRRGSDGSRKIAEIAQVGRDGHVTPIEGLQ